MSPLIPVPRSMVERKPPHGAPCTGCGVCCFGSLCPLAKRVFGNRPGPCPALVRQEPGKYGCGLVSDPLRHAPAKLHESGEEKLRAAALYLIEAGQGCCARINGEPASREFYDKLRLHDRATKDERRAAEKAWGF